MTKHYRSIGANNIISPQNNRTNMAQLTKRYEVKLTEQQSDTLEKLREYNIVPSKFIRIAIKEKLDRDYKSILKRKSTFEKLELKKLMDLYPNIFNGNTRHDGN